MSRWWRAYDDAVDDAKLLLLPSDKHRWGWFCLMCLASAHGGAIPEINVVAVKLRISTVKAAELITALVKAGLIDESEAGFAPHNWSTRQYRSDVTDPTNAERQKRFRNSKRNAVTTVTVTPTRVREQITETETEKKDSRAVVPTRPDDFDEFWKAYPKREGANPKAPARKAFFAALKAGAMAAEIIAGARACAARDRDKIGTPFIPQAVKWLRDRRWEDYAATGPPGSDQPAWMKPPPGAVSYLDKMRTNGNGATLGTEIRNDPGLGKSGADNAAELPLPGGGALRAS